MTLGDLLKGFVAPGLVVNHVSASLESALDLKTPGEQQDGILKRERGVVFYEFKHGGFVVMLL